MTWGCSMKEGEGFGKAAKHLIQGNGCTGVPDFWWKPCCDEHDKDYREGKIPKYKADLKFYRCLKATAKTPVGKYALAPLYHVGVAILGWWAWNKHRKNDE